MWYRVVENVVSANPNVVSRGKMAKSLALTEKKIKAAKPKPGNKVTKLTDGRGLFLLVQANGAKLWRFKYTFDGKPQEMSLGAYRDVSLATAREKHQAARKLLAADVNPMAQRKEQKLAQEALARGEGTFATVARKWQEEWTPKVSSRYGDNIENILTNDILPVLGAKAIDDIAAPDVVAMIKKIAKRGLTAVPRQALNWTSQIFRYGILEGLAKRNPAAEIKPRDILGTHKTKNRARVNERELPELLRAIDAYDHTVEARLALQLMVLTFVRSIELAATPWSELDLDAALWTIPGERMKMETPHFVPLSRQAVEILRTLRDLNGNREFVFPNHRWRKRSNSHMAPNTMLKALYRMGYKGLMTTHGFRGVAATALAGQGYDENHIEAQLAHLKRNKVAAAYNHAKYLPQRTQMMQEWADYLDRLRHGAKVIPFAS
jgi:integrase